MVSLFDMFVKISPQAKYILSSSMSDTVTHTRFTIVDLDQPTNSDS